MQLMLVMNTLHSIIFRLGNSQTRSVVCKFLLIVLAVLVFRALLSPSPTTGWFQQNGSYPKGTSTDSNLQPIIRKNKFLEVPQIIWGLNNQKIGLARACLTARFLNRTLLMPSLSASLFYKEVDLLQPINFDKVFDFDKFNSLCDGFVRLGRYSQLSNQTEPFVVEKGAGRKWTAEKDLDQLKQSRRGEIEHFEIVRIVGKHPFMWHDHWPVVDYSKVFSCLALVSEIQEDADTVISKIREAGNKARRAASTAHNKPGLSASKSPAVPYVAVHMRIEKDWMIHCKNREQRQNINEICSSKEEIISRVSLIPDIHRPAVVYLAVADSLLEDDSISSGWRVGLLPYEKKKLGITGIYKKHPYLIQSAIDFEVCSRADIFVGNSFSTFSSLVVLSRTTRILKLGKASSCGVGISLSSYAYNILGDLGGPKIWMTDVTASSLHNVSYGTINISCFSSPSDR